MSDNLSDVKHPISLNSSSRRSFAFRRPAFNGREFYQKYKSALFLSHSNIRLILANTNELQEQYDELQPNEEMEMEEMFVSTDVPLVLKKSATVDESDVNQDDFTLRRLCGLVAVVAFERKNDDNLYAVDSERYKLQKPYSKYLNGTCVYYKFKEYVAAINGTEYFIDCFNYLPFLMALNKFNLQHIDASHLISIGNMRHPDTQEPMAVRCYRSFEEADRVAKEDYGFDLKEVLQTAPKEVQVHFRIVGKMENTGSETKKK